jgi:hypothetical protein
MPEAAARPSDHVVRERQGRTPPFMVGSRDSGTPEIAAALPQSRSSSGWACAAGPTRAAPHGAAWVGTLGRKPHRPAGCAWISWRTTPGLRARDVHPGGPSCSAPVLSRRKGTFALNTIGSRESAADRNGPWREYELRAIACGTQGMHGPPPLRPATLSSIVSCSRCSAPFTMSATCSIIVWSPASMHPLAVTERASSVNGRGSPASLSTSGTSWGSSFRPSPPQGLRLGHAAQAGPSMEPGRIGPRGGQVRRRSATPRHPNCARTPPAS